MGSRATALDAGGTALGVAVVVAALGDNSRRLVVGAKEAGGPGLEGTAPPVLPAVASQCDSRQPQYSSRSMSDRLARLCGAAVQRLCDQQRNKAERSEPCRGKGSNQI